MGSHRSRAWVAPLTTTGLAVVALAVLFAIISGGAARVAAQADTSLAEAASQGDDSIVVEDPAGFAEGDCININAAGEGNAIDSIDGDTFNLVSPLVYDHDAGDAVIEVSCGGTPTPSPTPSPTPTATGTPPATGTATPTATATPPATATGTPAVTTTPTATATKTPTPAATATPTKTATPAATAVPATATPKAPPTTGMGSDSDGGSGTVYGLLALGGLMALAGAALVWRFRSHPA